MKNLISKKNKFYIDHIAIGVNNTEEGMAYIENLTGAKTFLPQNDGKIWYRSAALGLGNQAFLEIIGPNPLYKKFHPVKQILKELEKPQLIFWYLGTQNLESCKKIITESGHNLERYNHIQKEVDGEKLDYKIGVIGKGFQSERPCLIQWNKVPKNGDIMTTGCSIHDFILHSKNAKKINPLFNKLNVDLKIINGNNKMKLVLNSPKGLVTLEGGGFEFPSGIKGLGKMLNLYKRHIFR